jgi:hypothetical protein
MPKAAIDEDYYALGTKEEIRLPGKTGMPAPSGNSGASK